MTIDWLVLESYLWYLAAGLTAIISLFNVLIVALTGKKVDREIKFKYILYAGALTFWSTNVLIFSIVPNEKISYFCSQLLHLGAIFYTDLPFGFCAFLF